MRFIEHHHPNGTVFLTAEGIGTRHGFTTRWGGVSTGALSSLNLGENRGDEPAAVRENYRRLGEALGVDPERIVFPRQVHGREVRVATAADVHRLFTAVPYEADGLVTRERGLALLCFTADCVPVLLWDGENGVIGAVHCGWRSSVADILGNAIGKMTALGASPAAIHAAIGPAIGFCCFEVGGEVIEQAERYLGAPLGALCRAHPDTPGKYFLDLRGANARRLEQLGLKREHIACSEECTVCSHDKYWSHRYTRGNRGSQGALILLE